jgi:HD-GYP domain-containing protein (c-di-GMP phosphodiesterase class II)
MPAKISAIKKIEIRQLKVGMYIHDLSCGWMSHPFIRNRFLISSEAEIGKIIEAGFQEVYIDTGKGQDVTDAPTQEEVRAVIEREMTAIVSHQPAKIARATLAEELGRAKPVKEKARQLVGSLMQDVRLGKAIEIACVEPVVQNITDSIFRNSGALLGLLQIRNRDDYTFLHSVSVCALLVAFCKGTNLFRGQLFRIPAAVEALVMMQRDIERDRAYPWNG